MGTRLGRESDSTFDVTRDVEERAQNIAKRQALPVFDDCDFQAYVISGMIRPGGDLELKLGVPWDSKWEALKLSDAAGIMVDIHASRRRRDRQLVGEARGQHPGDSDSSEGSTPTTRHTFTPGAHRPCR